MKRNIIKIDEDKCNGCGLCIPNCPEGALQIIDGKARLVSDLFCDGLGACLGHCPLGAITVEEREAEPYDERSVMENVVKQGPNVIKAHLDHLKDHGEMDFYREAVAYLEEKGIQTPSEKKDNPPHLHASGGCPGAAAMKIERTVDTGSAATISHGLPPSQLRNWPVQLQLLNPNAPYLKGADLLVAADCVPFAFAGFHQRFLKDKVVVTYCPKLDQTIDQYVQKLAAIFSRQDIGSVSVVHMEVPCCSGTVHIVQKALELAQKVIPVKQYTISINGEII
jgi:ferredoxin